jgi:hypothetical protein
MSTMFRRVFGSRPSVLLALALIAGSNGCASLEEPTPAGRGTGNCKADLNQSPAALQPFPATLVDDGQVCAPLQRVEMRQCPSAYVAVSDSGGFGGNIRYYDGQRRLIGVWVYTDANRYCDGTSFDVIYGTKPSCPTTEVVTNLCR